MLKHSKSALTCILETICSLQNDLRILNIFNLISLSDKFPLLAHLLQLNDSKRIFFYKKTFWNFKPLHVKTMFTHNYLTKRVYGQNTSYSYVTCHFWHFALIDNITTNKGWSVLKAKVCPDSVYLTLILLIGTTVQTIIYHGDVVMNIF